MTDPVARSSPPACNAPFTSMYLDQHGDARACCQNTWYRLGSIRESTLSEIWHGERAQRLRAALAAGRFDLGCEGCEVLVRQGSADSAYLTNFAALHIDRADPPFPRRLELALSNTCNLQCAMCNGDQSSAIRSHREHRPPLPTVYGDAFFDELRDLLPHLDSLTLLGGEPFLSTEVRRVLDLVAELNPRIHVHVTTNGTVMNPRVERFAAKQPCHIAVSIDGATAEVNEAIRIGTEHSAVLANVARFRDLTASNGSTMSLAFSLMRDNVHELGALLRLGDDLGLDVYVNRVTSPPTSSLHHLDADDLAVVLRGLTAEDAALGDRLGRNRAAWDRELEQLGRHHAGLRDAAAVPVAVRVSEPRRAPDATVSVGPDQIVTDVVVNAPGHLTDLPAVTGDSTTAVMDFVLASLGELSGTTIDFENGTEVRAMVFDGPIGRHVFRAELHGAEHGAHRWDLWVDPERAAGANG